MEIRSENNHNRRQRGNQSGGGNRNRNRQGNRNRNRSGNRNRGGGGGGNRNRNRNRNRGPRPPKQTKGQKILSMLTFGLLGKPKVKSKGKSQAKKHSQQKPQAKKAANNKPKSRRKRTEVTSGRLYVGNLVYEANESDLEELFRGAGNVLSAEVVTNSRTQQSKGFAFVEMGSIDEAKRAVSILDDEDFRGRKLIVCGARSEGPRSGDDGSDKDSSSDEEVSLENQPTQPLIPAEEASAKTAGAEAETKEA